MFDRRQPSPQGKRKAAETPMMEISAAKVGGDEKGGGKTGLQGRENPTWGQAARHIGEEVHNRLTRSRLRKHDAASKKIIRG